jgi:hypothetical protein
MKPVLSFLLVVHFGTLALARQSTEGKEESVVKILGVINKLSQIASAAAADESRINPKAMAEYETYTNSLRQKVEKEIRQIKEPDELVAIARVCRAILGSQDADDATYDRVFSIAYWHCVTLLAANTSYEAVHALNVLNEPIATRCWSLLRKRVRVVLTS